MSGCRTVHLSGAASLRSDPLKVGDNTANSGSTIVSAVTRPGGGGITLYLMEIQNEYYNEDIKAGEEKIRKREGDMFNPRSIDGGYGNVRRKDNTSESSGEL